MKKLSRILIAVALATGVAWWLHSRRTAAAESAGRAADGASDAWSARLRGSAAHRLLARIGVAMATAELHRPKGLCGSEFYPPDEEPRAFEMPPELAALAEGTPDADAIARAAADLGLSEGDALDPGALAHAAAASRFAVEVAGEADPGPAAEAERMRQLGRPAEAATLLEDEYRRDGSANTAVSLAYAKLDAHDAAGARALSDQILADPRSATEPTMHDAALALRATACSQLHDRGCFDGALDTLSTGGADPSLRPFLLGYDLAELGKPAEAMEAFASAGGVDHATSHNLGAMATCLGRTDEARAHFSQALAMAGEPGEYAVSLADLGSSWLDDGDLARAWLFGSASVVAGGDGAQAVHGHATRAAAALLWGDDGLAVAETTSALGADGKDDLVSERCFHDGAWSDAFRALRAEARHDTQAAADAWLKVARSGSTTLQTPALRALKRICP